MGLAGAPKKEFLQQHQGKRELAVVVSRGNLPAKGTGTTRERPNADTAIAAVAEPDSVESSRSRASTEAQR